MSDQATLVTVPVESLPVRNGTARLILVGTWPLTLRMFSRLSQCEYEEAEHLGRVMLDAGIVGIHKVTGELVKVRDWFDDDDESWRAMSYELPDVLAKTTDETSARAIRAKIEDTRIKYEEMCIDIKRKDAECAGLPMILLVEGEPEEGRP